MADLGQDVESLHLKVMEVEHSIRQKEVAKSGIALERARIELKLKQYSESTTQIDEQIAQHVRDRASLVQAINNLEAPDART